MIRFIFGLLVVFGSVGGMDNATDAELLYLLPIAVFGLACMYYGSKSPSVRRVI
jgi:hypothetical protein